MIAEIYANNSMVLKLMPLCCVNFFFLAFAHLFFVFLEIALNVSSIVYTRCSAYLKPVPNKKL